MATSSNGIQPQLPRLNGKNYKQWNIMMKALFGSQDLWEIVENGYDEPADQTSLNPQQLTALKENRKKDKKALFFIYQAVDEAIFERISAQKHQKKPGTFSILHTKEKIK